MGAFDSAWRKWKRGNVHAEALYAEVYTSARNSYLQSLQEIDTEYDAKRHCIIVSLRSVVPPPPEWSSLLGDVVNNYHSVLDHIAWAVVQRGTEASVLSEKALRYVYFPMNDERAGFNSSLATKLPGGRRTDVAIIRRYQPYIRGQRNLALHVLTNLNAFSRLDKHRELQPTDIRPLGAEIMVEAAQDCIVRQAMVRVRSQPIKEDAEVARVPVKKTGPNPDVFVNGTITFDVAMNDRIWLRSWLTEVKAFLAQLLLEFDDPPSDVPRPVFQDGWLPGRLQSGVTA